MCGFLEKMSKRQKQNSKENLFKTAKCVTRYQKPMFFSFLTCLKQQKNEKSKLRFMSILTISSNRSPNLRIGQCAATITPYTHVYAHVDINMWNSHESAAPYLVGLFTHAITFLKLDAKRICCQLQQSWRTTFGLERSGITLKANSTGMITPTMRSERVGKWLVKSIRQIAALLHFPTLSLLLFNVPERSHPKALAF